MPRVSNIELLYRPEQTVISIRKKAAVTELPMIIGESYGKLAKYLEECGEILSDVPFVAYHNMDMQNLDVEMGFPISKELPGKEDIKASVLPAGKVAFCMYRGAYGEIEPVYNEMMKWISGNGFQMDGPSYEYYYNGNEFPESEMLTKIVLPVK